MLKDTGLLMNHLLCTEVCLCWKTAVMSRGDGPIPKYRNLFHETENVTSVNQGFHTKSHNLATYQQREKMVSHSYSKRNAEADGLRTLQLQVYYLLFFAVYFFIFIYVLNNLFLALSVFSNRIESQ